MLKLTGGAKRSKYDVNILTQQHFNNSKRPAFGSTKATDINLIVDDASANNIET